jgi:hypothetical protein
MREPLPDPDARQSPNRDEPHALAYNLKRMITIFGVGLLMEAIRT